MTYIKKLKETYDNLRKTYNINDEQIEYFEKLYDKLNKEDFLAKLVLVSISYGLIQDISNEDRALFIEGMSAYLKMSSAAQENDMENINYKEKKYLVMDWAYGYFGLDYDLDMFEEGVKAAIKLSGENNITKKRV